MTLAALELLTRLDDPLMRPDIKSSVKELVASVKELAPVRIFPRLMMLVTLLRSIDPADWKIWYRLDRADPVLEPVDEALDVAFLMTEQEERRRIAAAKAAIVLMKRI